MEGSNTLTVQEIRRVPGSIKVSVTLRSDDLLNTEARDFSLVVPMEEAPPIGAEVVVSWALVPPEEEGGEEEGGEEEPPIEE